MPLANLKDREHRTESFRVPLSARALDIVRELAEARVSEFVFPGQKHEKPLSNIALLTLLDRMNSATGSGSTPPEANASQPTASEQRSRPGRMRPRPSPTPSSRWRSATRWATQSNEPIAAPI